MFCIVRSVYPPEGVPNMRTELTYPGDESLKLWSSEKFEDTHEPRSAIPAVKNSCGEGPVVVLELDELVLASVWRDELNNLGLQTEINQLLDYFVLQVKGSTASGYQDINKASESFLRDLFEEVFDLPNLYDLNDEKPNFPGLDLGDDNASIAFQVTSDNSLSKIQKTLRTVIDHKLHERFKVIKVFVLTEKQRSYSQDAIDQVCGSALSFDVSRNIIDYRDILNRCSKFGPKKQERVLSILREYVSNPVFSNSHLVKEKQREEQSFLTRIPQRWCHETTNDETYVRRSGKTSQLVEWFNNKSIRAISITGIGGAGKTALLGYWLKHDNSRIEPRIEGLFYWSFYANKRVDDFLLELIRFLDQLEIDVNFKLESLSPIQSFEKFFHKLPPILLLLDGMEVLQECVSEGKSYGSFIDATLRDFLQMVVYAKRPWLCISTSRFPLTDFNFVAGTENMCLTNLEADEGAEVLYNNGVLGASSERVAASQYLEGHPLALRIFAASLPKQRKTTPKKHLQEVFGRLDDENEFLNKLFRLLDFYSNTLSEIQESILETLALFRSPIPLRSIELIVPTINQSFPTEAEVLKLTLITELGRLSSSGLAVRDSMVGGDVFSCHPIVRDYFRDRLLNDTGGKAAIDILTSRPDELGIQGVSNLEPLLLATEALLHGGDIQAAIEIYVTRFKKGGAFLAGGLPKEGKRFYDLFERRVSENAFLLEAANLGLDHGADKVNLDVFHFRNGAIYFDILLGELEDAKTLLETQGRELQGPRRSITHNHTALLSYHMGDFEGAVTASNKTTSGGNEGGAVSALIHAQANYLKLKALQALGMNSEARKTAQEIKRFCSNIIEPEGRILDCMASVWLGIDKRQVGDGRGVRRVKSMARDINEQHLALEAKLLVARWYIVTLGPEKQSKKLLEEVYETAVKQSYPFFVISSQILKAYYSYAYGTPLSDHLLDEAATKSEANKMRGLYAESLWVSALVASKHRGNVLERGPKLDYLINALSYNGLEKLYPPLSNK